MVGTTISHYKVLEKIGQGGMGEVYRAEDTTLKREVAIKVLPEQFTKDPQRLARFEREAQLLAQLNHSNIAAIYGFEHSDDIHFLVLELVPGETLRKRVAKGPVPVEEVLEVCRQIAEGLEAAHEKGVIHRDLKPANVKVTPEGKVKILDFGLAKAFEAEPPVTDISQSPTLTEEMTRAGVLLGTAAYMSPEQARGKPVDKRTDIWAFGCVLFEMLSGQAAFSGEDITDLLAALVRSEPEWSCLPAPLHPRLPELLERCLEKEAKNRWHDIADVRLDIQKVQKDPDGLRVEVQGVTSRGSRRVLTTGAAAFAVGAVLAGIAVWVLTPESAAEARIVRFSFNVPETPEMDLSPGKIALSPDGTRIAYIGALPGDSDQQPGEAVRQLYLRSMQESQGTPVPGTEGARHPFFSPDGAWVGFVAGGKLQKVPVSGGAPLEICNAWNMFGASWGQDDRIIFGGGIGSGLLQVAVAGGTPKSLTSPDPEKGEVHHGSPEILPDGRTVLFTIGTGNGSHIAKLSLDTGQWEELLPSGAGPRYLSAGYIVFSENGNLRLARFDMDTGQVNGSVVPVLDGVQWQKWGGLEIAAFEVSRTGDLALVPGGHEGFQRRPVWVDHRGRETTIDVDPDFYITARISPDERGRVALNKLNELGIGEIWVMNADGSQAFPVADEGTDYNPVWTTDASTLTYTSHGNIFEIVVDQEAERVPFLRRENYQFPRSWSPDGQFLAFVEFLPTGSRVWIMSRDGEPEALLDSSFNSLSPRFAPQGDWIAYVSDESGEDEVYVRRYPGLERGRLVSRDGGREPVWASNGEQLFYRSGDRMMAVEITTEPNFRNGEPVELWERPYYSQEISTSYDVDSEGRFLMLALPDATGARTGTINVVLDWFTEIEERMQASN